eukprot:TRINITY_DN2541_c0_g1_i1.p1 TRINITY_DN2541_c0_g1~~TRINITY_DN2541_c0_g1_i1.p1  ORF type:complete len:615 (-),score=144.41 TRINITY_DN2541_c0_g1_i1:316-2160(-)
MHLLRPSFVTSRSVLRSSTYAKLQVSLQKRSQTDVTHQYQNAIPRLPLPSLLETIPKYLQTVQPLVSKEAFEKTTKIAEDFLKNEGPILQAKLEAYDRSRPQSSYIAEFWDEMYLTGRYPVLINSNPYIILNPSAKHNNQVSRAANLIKSTCKFVEAYRNRSMLPDLAKTTPMDMYQYSLMFGTSRIPKEKRDLLMVYNQAKHMLVIHKNKFHCIHVLNQDNSPVPEEQIAEALRGILAQNKNRKSEKYDLTTLTSEDRDVWAKQRDVLEALSPENDRNLSIIDSALFAVVLEDQVPSSLTQAGQLTLHGTGANRWFDKSLMWVVYGDSTAGLNFEHSWGDGHSVLRYVDDMCAVDTNAQPLEGPASSDFLTLDIQTPASVQQAIQEAGQRFDAFAGSNDHAAVVVKGVGKKYITSHRLSPDSFVQMTFQLAHWRRHQKTVSTYESCNTKHFLRGRTECIRSVTPQSVLFASTFDDQSVDDSTRFQRLKAAIEAHNTVASYCKQGRGVDRHLYGLLNIAKRHEMKLPAIFTDPSYATMGSSILSTSGLYSPYTALFGFGAVHQDGYGVGYMVGNDSITFSVSNFNKDASQFADILSKSIRDVAELAQRVQGSSK